MTINMKADRYSLMKHELLIPFIIISAFMKMI